MCCSYKVSRRGLLLMTMLTFLFAVIFIAVGSVSARFGSSFVSEANVYCQEMCLLEDMHDDVVGCNCEWNPPGTSLPTIFFLSPAIGMIVVGIFTFFTSILGCLGAIRERNLMLSGYICALLLVIILQFSFGVAAATVATGNSAQVQGPLNGVLKKNYKLFDWQSMEIFFPEACYAGSKTEQVGDPALNETYTYHFPLCRFDGGCVYNDPEAVGTPLYDLQNMCCDSDRNCASNNKAQCMSGEQCVVSFLARVGAPIAVVAFLALIIEISALVFACIIRVGTADRKYGDRA
eukprot:CAMPEP_0174928042 /NCGR_PEP_ID=MMETSP1355-20121228/22703_1 /TAXON_ID=464990 /ORGANISM="Hemiselmis tepida, Strain CCMP443" /LENGTH=290 /DNA_ID=CAMNT_0016174183 /DNA_START=98 /DNA_END=970 /DNA_ORIENTATION=-